MCRENVNKLIHLFLLALFLSYYGSITFFSHYHVVNGVTIVHSHFFCGHADADGKADHTHSPKELTLIAYLTTFVTLISRCANSTDLVLRNPETLSHPESSRRTGQAVFHLKPTQGSSHIRVINSIPD